MIQTGYRIGMLIAGAGALMIAARASWFAAYAMMAVLIGLGMVVLLLAPEPAQRTRSFDEPRSGKQIGSVSRMARRPR